ncbi:MAG TPA: hypothetical protein V6D28_29580 [Leptolyngbyaceae cyanobacterium]
MVSTPEERSQSICQESWWKIRESKILHKSPILHPLARFITEEAVALMFHLALENVYRITCLRYVVHVHGKGVSRFVSYADFSPILAVNPPTSSDFVFWRKRWHKKPAQELWQKFYTIRFKNALSVMELFEWGTIVNMVKSLLSEEILTELRELYVEKKNWFDF